MSLYKRKDSPNWWVKLSANGQTLQRSTGTPDKKSATEYHDKLKAQLWEQERLGVKPRYSWKEAVVKYLAEATHKASLPDDMIRLRWLDKHLGGLMLDEISRGTLHRVQQLRIADGVSHATANRCMSLVSRVLRKAQNDWEWISYVPKISKLPEPRERVRFLEFDDWLSLYKELPDHLASIANFALVTGLRMTNVVALQWSHVDLQRGVVGIDSDQAKSGKG
jgi:integrase